MSILFNILIGYAVICTVLCSFFFVGLFKHLRKELGDKKVINEIKQSIKLVYIEKVDNICYMYDGLTNSFITQAATEEELWRNAKLRYPNKEFIIKGNNGNAVVVNFNVESTQ